MKTAVEIYKLLPKTNCGKCGTGACFGFAAKLATRQGSIDDCPFLTRGTREELRSGGWEQTESPGTVYEQALVSLKPKVLALDFEVTAKSFGARLIDANTIEIGFLNQTFRVAKDKITNTLGKQPRPWISILIYNHLCMPDPPRPSGQWITFSSVPAAHAKAKAWAGHVEEVIANHFSGKVRELKAACEKLGGAPFKWQGKHDAVYEFRLFPHYPVLLQFYDAAPAEDFPAQCKILLDKNAPKYLDIESMVVLGEEFAARLTAKA